jgi:hypothetical protein
MKVQVNIEFNQLLAIEQESKVDKSNLLEELLLTSPTATPLDTIINNRKAINQWRTK